MKPLYKILSTTTDWNTFFSHANDLTKHEKGELFEKLTELILLTKPVYKTRYKNVWLLREGVDSKLRTKLNLPNADEGIDLIAELYNGGYCSIQCKFKGANESPTRKDIATFLDLSRNHCKNITEQILAHTGTNGIKKTALLPDSFTQIGLDFWSQLAEEDWSAIQQHIKGKKIPNVKRKPREHQREAIETSKKHFLKNSNTRGKLLMPCGTGKSLTAFWINQALGSKSTILAVPSLALIKQSIEDWTKDMYLSKPNELPDWSCICSDESTGQLSDDLVSDTYSLGIPTTTNEKEIGDFLTRVSPNGKIIFTTYQSADKLAQVSKKLNFKFDLAILDEAHKTVGVKDKAFSILLQEDKISIGKRLFMTATERIVKGADDDILSMDDADTYGEVFYKLSFKKAIEDGIITDYKIVTVLVNDTEIQDLIKKNKYVTDHGKNVDEAEAQMLTTAIALKKAIEEYSLKHTVSFHKSIDASKKFQSLYQKIDTGKDSPTVFHISSKLNAGARAKLLKDFRNTNNAIITNARCLTEGVDVPAIDCVLFADQKQSVVDIVQASGRALRQYKDKNTGVKKEVGYIVIPVVLKEGESLDDLTESSRFKTVTRIVTSLSTQDETIAEELKLIDSSKQKTGTGKIQVIGNVNKSIKLDLSSFSLKIKTKLWERIAKLNIRNFEDARSYSRGLNLPGIKEWILFYRAGNIEIDIPLYPDQAYKGRGWNGWYDWLGNEELSPEANFNRAIQEINKYFNKHGNTYIPNNYILDDGFKLGQFCRMIRGQKKLAADKKEILENIKGWVWDIEDDKFKKMFAALENFMEENGGLPNKGLNNKYVHIGDYKLELGSWVYSLRTLYKKIHLGQIKKSEAKRLLSGKDDPRIKQLEQLPFWEWSVKSEFMAFENAKEFVRNLKLKKRIDYTVWWRNEGKTISPQIPAKPDQTYAKDGWLGWSDWMGSKIEGNWDISKKFFSLSDAKKFLRKHSNGKIISQSSYKKWVKNQIDGMIIKPVEMPAVPWQTYKNDPEWKGLGDFLGTNRVASRSIVYLSYDKAKKRLQKEKLNSREEYYSWLANNSNLLKQEGILLPKHCNQTYKAEWEGWNIFLSKNNPHGKKNIPWMEFHKARKFVRALGLKNGNEWHKYCRGEFKNLPKPPYNIPVFPHRYYKNDGYTTLMDWLGKKESRIDKKVVSLKVAKQFAAKLNLKKTSDWKLYLTGKIEGLPALPEGVPQNPNRWYQNDPEWKGMGDFLNITNKFNIKYLPFIEAKKKVKSLNLKSQKEWKKYCSSGIKPIDIPSNPNSIYANDGWLGYGDWLGTNNVRTRDIQYTRYKDALKMISSLKLKSSHEYTLWWRDIGKNLVPKLPAKPFNTYKNDGWISWQEWLGKKK